MRSKLFMIILFAILAPHLILAEKRNKVVDVKRHTLKQGNTVFRYGSGLSFRKASTYGSTTFYTVPGGEYLITNGKDGRDLADIPHVAVAKLRKDKFKISNRFPLFFKDNQELTVDLEGVATASDKTVWLADEANNYLLKVSLKNGEVKEVLKPGEDLPIELKDAHPNRGIESITLTPNGIIFAAVQSVLDLPGANSILVFSYNPASGKQKTYTYPVNLSEYITPYDAKIGDIQSIDNNRFLFLEQGQGANSYHNRIFLVTLKNSEIRKELLIDLRQHNWNYRKAEGLTLLDPATIAVINDWDDDVSTNELWLFQLSKPLIGWTWKEWALFVVLMLIFVLSMVVMVVMLLKPKQD